MSKCVKCKCELIVPSWKTCQQCDFKKRGSPFLAAQRRRELERRDLLMLNLFLQGKTNKDIAQIYNLTASAVQIRLQKFKEYAEEQHRRRLNNSHLFKDRVESA